MPAIAVPKGALAFGAGYLYSGNLGTSLPANTVAGSVFTDAWPAGWNPLGITKTGHEVNYNIQTEDVESAEYLDALTTVTTGRTAGVSMELMQIHLTNFKRVLNGGTLTTSGSGATLLSTYKPPQVGQEVRCMLGWESQDGTERWVAEQCFQIGSLTIPRRKGAEVAALPTEWRFEPNAAGDPFTQWGAGALRG